VTASRPARITVINDSPEFVELVRDVGQELGHTVAGFEAVDAGITEIAASRPDLLIIDLVLGDPAQTINGWELLLLARAHRDLRHVPIILVTADVGGVKDRAPELATMSNVHVLTKPFGLDDIEPLLTRLLTP
jgi:DNA-binding response OmpR family regulator